MNPPSSPETTRDLFSQRLHAHCFVCGSGTGHGLGVQFAADDSGTVTARWRAHPDFESYDDHIHGGILSTLLDAAMLHALFARGIAAAIAEMTVRFPKPAVISREVTVRGWVVGTGRVLLTRAEIIQNGVIVAHASAKSLPAPGQGRT